MINTCAFSVHRTLSFYFVSIFFGACISCSNSLKIEEVKSTLVENPLIVSINFSGGVQGDAFVQYWPFFSDNKLTTQTSYGRTRHSIILMSLVAETTYEYQIYLKNGESELTSNTYNFTTGKLPEHLPKFDLVSGSKYTFGGFIMLRKMDAPGSQIILNSNGEIVWFQMSDSVIFRPFSLTSDTTYLALKGTNEIIEMNFLGDTILYLNQENSAFDKNAHHEIFKDEQGHIVTLTKQEKEFDLSKFTGSKNETVVGDGILVLDSDGSEIWSWNIFDAVDVTPSQELFKFRKDWSHANALSKDTDGNFLISFRNFNQIWKVDATDGHVIWKLGENGDFSLSSNEYFKYQHAVHVNSRGNIMLFDNISNNNKTSRALAFAIDDEANIAETTLVVNLPDSLYSFKQGSVYFIDSAKLLFCSSMSKKIAVTDLEGNILWQVNSDQSFYRAEYIDGHDYL